MRRSRERGRVVVMPEGGCGTMAELPLCAGLRQGSLLPPTPHKPTKARAWRVQRRRPKRVRSSFRPQLVLLIPPEAPKPWARDRGRRLSALERRDAPSSSYHRAS